MDSAGSAMAENEKYLDSIQGRIDLFTNSLQTMWMNFINADAVKFVVDLGSAVIKFVDAMGVLPTAVGGFTVFKSAAADIKKEFDAINNGAIETIEIFKTKSQEANALDGVSDSLKNVSNATKSAGEASEEYHQITMDEILATQDKQKATEEAVVAEQMQGEVTKATAGAKALDTIETIKNTVATNANVVATKALAAAKAVALGLLKGMALMLASKVIMWGFSKIADGIDGVIHHAENLKKEVAELQDTYKEAKDTFDDNLITLTTSSDTSSFATLKDEFAVLAKGVDQYGNNISLTSDQYERYKQICEQIVGINPSIAAGYNSATEAIGRNVDVLSDLIELQREQARLAAEEFVNDENIDKYAESSIEDYKKAAQNYKQTRSNTNSDLYNIFKGKYNGKSLDGDASPDNDIMRYVLNTLLPDLDPKYVTEEINKFYRNGEYDIASFFQRYSNSIIQNADKFGPEINAKIQEYSANTVKAMESAEQELKEAQNGPIDVYLNSARAAEGYYDLNNAGNKFINEWIRNSDQFKVDENTTGEIIKQNRDQIIKVVDAITNTDLTIDFKGQQFTAQDLLDQLYNFDMSTVNWEEYKSEMNALIDTLSQLTGIDTATLKVTFGFDFEGKEKNKQTYIDQIEGHIDLTEEQIQSRLDNMNAKQIKAFYAIDWNAVDWDNVTSWEDVRDLINQQAEAMSTTVSVKTYSDMSAAVDNFNDVQSQTAAIIADNTEVSQDYKTALEGLGATEEELNEIFDESNPLLVKNAALLQKLVAQKRNEQAANVKVAKSQAMQQYKKATLQLNQLTTSMHKEYQAQGKVSEGTLRASDILREQIEAIKQTIQQYALLELKLSDAAKAYNEFEAAKARDAELNYGDSSVEMLNTIKEGLETGKVGTEAFQAAVKAMVPDSVYSNLDTVAEKMQAIQDYIYGDSVFTKFFAFDGENFSIAYENVDEFVKYCQEQKLFTGEDSSHFDLSDDVESLEDFADQLGITEAAALAMLTELSKYDGEWSNILAKISLNPLERSIYDSTTALEQAQNAQQEFIKNGGDLNSQAWKDLCAEVERLKAELQSNTEKAQSNASQWVQLQTIYDAACGKIQLTQGEVDALCRSLGILDANGNVPITVNDDGTISLTEDGATQLNETLEKLKEPTTMSVQPNVDQWQKDIDGLQEAIETKDFTAEVAVKYGVTDEQSAQEQIGALQKQITVSGLHFGATVTKDSTLEKLTDWESNGMKFSVNMNAEQPKEDINELNTEKDKLSEPETTTYIVNGTGESTVKDINNYWAGIVGNKSTTYTIYENKVVTETSTRAPNAPSSSAVGSGQIKVDGTAHASGTADANGDWGAPKTETALGGELGPEILVRNGKWQTIGENGAEFFQVKKGDIIFNHKQTEELLKNGYVTGRGKMASGGAYAEGTAYAGLWKPSSPGVGNSGTWSNYNPSTGDWGGSIESATDKLNDVSSSLSDSADNLSDATDKFEEVFDWVEVRLQEIDETLDLLNSKLENAVGYVAQNSIIDQMLGVSNIKMTNLQAGLKEYTDYAAKLLAKVPAQYQEAAQNGAIAITEFAGEADEATVESINNYREWADKVADLTQQMEDLKNEIADLAKQKFDNVSNQYDNIVDLIEKANDKLEAQVDLMEDRGYVASKKYYESMAVNTKKRAEELVKERDAMQAVLDEQVELGNIQVGSDAWYEMVAALYDVDAAIVECTSDLESYQNAINDIYWDNFDELINRVDYLNDETQNLIDLMDNKDMVSKPDNENGWSAEDVTWTDEGLASLGLYAQQMEIAEYRARQYAKAIDDLNKDYADGKYSESEYLEKLNELKSAQYDSIEAYYDAQDAIKDLNSARIDVIKDGIEKEIDAYEELIEKKKEALDAEKDIHDFQKSVAEKQKDITDIQHKLAALQYDNSTSAAAQRKKLEAELAKAQNDLQETYYDRSVEDKKEALDKELESFQEEKNAEIEKWEKYLEDVEQVVADSLLTIQANASDIYATLGDKANEYNLTLSDAIMSPWKDGAIAISDYQEVFDTAASSTWDQLEAMRLKWQEVIDKMNEAAEAEIRYQQAANDRYVAASPDTDNQNSSSTPEPATKTVGIGSTINASGATIYASSYGDGASGQYFASDPIYVVIGENNGYWKVRHRSQSSGVTGWFKKSDVKAYAKGTKGIKEDQLAWIDELGEELVLNAGPDGRLQYLSKGTSVIPAKLTENLMKLGQLNPQDILDRNRPSISAPHIINNNMELSMDIAEVVHIDTVTNDTIPDLTKAVEKQLDNYMKKLNGQIRKYSR